MSRRNSIGTDFFSVPIRQEDLFASLSTEEVAPCMAYDAATQTRFQRQREDSLLQWEVVCLARPRENDDAHGVGLVTVKIWAKTKPVIKVGAPVQFVDLRVRPWAVEGASGMSFSAAGMKPQA